ncbi:MAG: flagellar assembly factor FliW [Thermosediminibacterales bacterium]|nr:flagellar assembly factor FliW [Thermosediminibacterales bacterium]
MRFKTRRFGEIEVNEEEVFEFEKGLFGFEELKRYVLIDIHQNPAFKWLQPVDDSEVAFLLVDPFLVKKDYYVEIDDQLKTELEIEKEEDVLVYTIVTVPQTGFRNATTNLIGPLVINIKKRKGRQIIVERDDLTIKYPLFLQNYVNKKTSSGG